MFFHPSPALLQQLQNSELNRALQEAIERKKEIGIQPPAPPSPELVRTLRELSDIRNMQINCQGSSPDMRSEKIIWLLMKKLGINTVELDLASIPGDWEIVWTGDLDKLTVKANFKVEQPTALPKEEGPIKYYGDEVK